MKRLSLLISILLIFAVLGGCYTGGGGYPPGNGGGTDGGTDGGTGGGTDGGTDGGTGGGTTPTPTPVPTQPPASGLNLTARPDKNTYCIGDELVVTVQADQISYLTLFNISADGTVTRIFPNAYDSSSMLQGGQIYYIPGQSDGYRLKVTGPKGTEHIYAIATLQNVNLVAPRLNSDPFPRFTGSVTDFEQALDYQLSGLAASEWARVNMSFQVQ